MAPGAHLPACGRHWFVADSSRLAATAHTTGHEITMEGVQHMESVNAFL
jgi:hypothetical protein